MKNKLNNNGGLAFPSHRKEAVAFLHFVYYK